MFNNLIFITMKSKMTYRLYKDEFSSEFVYRLENDRIEGLMATDESSEKVLVISGDIETLEKLGDIMFVNDEQKIKKVFPSYVTKEESDNYQKQIFDYMLSDLRDNLCRMTLFTKGTHCKDTKEYDLMYEMFCKMDDLQNARA